MCDDVYGVMMCVQFEKVGYQMVEVVVDVEKNGLMCVFLVFYVDGEQVGMSGVCMMFIGCVLNVKGKGVKGFIVCVLGDGFLVEVVVVKNGEYELLFWNVFVQVMFDVEMFQGSFL